MPYKYTHVGNDRRIITKSDLLIADDFTRIVHGGKGDYVEIGMRQMHWDNIHIPITQRWRLNGYWKTKVYYNEYRSNCDSKVKIYFQLKKVNYADYRIGYFYISPRDLLNFERIIPTEQ